MSDFNYKDKTAPKLNDEFKQKFGVNIKGKEAIKLEGLTAFAHEKGMWKFDTEIIQFPSDQNGWTAICKTTIGGYDYDPVTDKVREVEYSDIGDANTNNGSCFVYPYGFYTFTGKSVKKVYKYRYGLFF